MIIIVNILTLMGVCFENQVAWTDHEATGIRGRQFYPAPQKISEKGFALVDETRVNNGITAQRLVSQLQAIHTRKAYLQIARSKI